MGQQPVPTFLSEKELADHLRVSLSTVRRWRKNRTSPRFCRVGNVIRYQGQDVERSVESHLSSAA